MKIIFVMRKLFLIILLMFYVSCAGTSATNRSSDLQKKEMSLRPEGGAFSKAKRSADMLMDQEADYAGDVPAPAPSSQAMKTAEERPSEVNAEKPERKVIFKADYRISVKSLKDSSKTVDKYVKNAGGYIEAQEINDAAYYATITVRVPISKFEGFLVQVEKIGNVLSKNVTSKDITEQYADIELEMVSLENTLKRMYSLLKKEKDVKERVKILKEIERIESRLESIRATLKYLKNQADFSTVVLNLTTESRSSVRESIPSPFSWIRGLSFEKRSLKKMPGVEYLPPDGYFSFEKNYKDQKSEWMFIAPGEEAFIRIGKTDNYPAGAGLFWEKALMREGVNRNYDLLYKDKIDSLSGGIYRFDYKVTNAAIYSISFAVMENDIVVIESYFPDLEKYNRKKETLKNFLSSLRLK